MGAADLRVGLVRTDDILFHPHNVRTDLGDLRTLTNSIKQFGVMQPVVVEHYGHKVRLRAGHRRVAAARLAGLTRIPAVIHPEPLDDDEWIVQSIQENEIRRNLDRDDRRRAVLALRDVGCTWEGIAEAFAVSVSCTQKWARGADNADPQQIARTVHRNAERRAWRRLAAAHRVEFDQLVQEELLRPPAEPKQPKVRKRQWAKADLVLEVEHLMAAGEGVQGICARFASAPGAVAKRLYRAGRSDLANLFEAAKRAEKAA